MSRKNLPEKYKLKDHEFLDYKFKSKASKAVRKRICRAAKKVNKKLLWNN